MYLGIICVVLKIIDYDTDYLDIQCIHDAFCKVMGHGSGGSYPFQNKTYGICLEFSYPDGEHLFIFLIIQYYYIHVGMGIKHKTPDLHQIHVLSSPCNSDTGLQTRRHQTFLCKKSALRLKSKVKDKKSKIQIKMQK